MAHAMGNEKPAPSRKYASFNCYMDRIVMSSPSPNARAATRHIGITLGALLICSLAAGNGHAQWLVSDVEHTRANAAAWVEQWAKWKQQFDQWEQQYFTMHNIVQAGPAFLQADQLQPRAPDDGVEQRCPSPGMFSSQIAKQQHVFCKMLVETDNGRYNVLVDLNKQVDARNQEMQAILARRITQAASSDLGGLKAFNAEMQTFQANVDNDVHNAKAALDHYESVIRAIKDQQAQLTEKALKSTPSSSGAGLIGGAVQGVTLKAALQSAKHW